MLVNLACALESSLASKHQVYKQHSQSCLSKGRPQVSLHANAFDMAKHLKLKI
jgi:hypothetical protein